MQTVHVENKNKNKNRSAALVLLQTKVGTEKEVLVTLRKMKNVVHANLVYGVYDIIVKVEGDSINELKKIIISNIRQLENVYSTLTLIIYENLLRQSKTSNKLFRGVL
jgi:Lrp/AsnC family transcriptional regulator for asnA, asnC and gidA